MTVKGIGTNKTVVRPFFLIKRGQFLIYRLSIECMVLNRFTTNHFSDTDFVHRLLPTFTVLVDAK